VALGRTEIGESQVLRFLSIECIEIVNAGLQREHDESRKEIVEKNKRYRKT